MKKDEKRIVVLLRSCLLGSSESLSRDLSKNHDKEVTPNRINELLKSLPSFLRISGLSIFPDEPNNLYWT